MTSQFQTGDITDPDPIKLVHMELLLEYIFLSLFPVEFPIVLLCCGADTGQAHFPHQFGYILSTDPMDPLHKNSTNLIST